MIVEGLGIAVVKAAYDMHKSDKINEQASKKMVRSYSKIAEAQGDQKEAEERMNKAVLRLVNRKKAILSTSMQDFLNLYEKVIKINFTESDGIRELEYFSLTEVEELHTQISVARNMPSMPSITKNMIVGYLLGGVMGAITSSIVDDSQKALDLAKIQSKQADMLAQQAQIVSLSCYAVQERANYMTDVLTKLNILFVRGIQYTEGLIEKLGLDKRSYSQEDRKSLAACINIAGAIKSILDVPIIDQEGELTKKSMQAIQLGEQCLQAIDFAMSN